jgi:hypothetical protein
MEMRKQGGEGQGTARSASKSRKQPGEQTNQDAASANQAATAREGSSMDRGASPNPGTTPTQGATGNQKTSLNKQTGQQAGGEQDLLQHAKHATGEIVNKVQQQAGSQLDRQKETAASELSQVANAVRRIRENLPQEEMGTLARFVGDYGEKAANNLERLSTYIREKDPKQLLDDVQNFGRRQPVLLLGGAFLLGFAGARLIRSSINTGSQQRSRQTNVQPTFTPQNVSAPGQSTNPGAV